MIHLRKKAKSKQTPPIKTNNENRDSETRQEEPAVNDGETEVPREVLQTPLDPVKGKPEPPIYTSVKRNGSAKRDHKRKRKGR